MDKKYWSGRIQTLVPYTPGEQPRDRVFIKLNTNENPYPPSPNVFSAIQANADARLRLYPDPEAVDLRRAIADFYNVEPNQVFCGNGSDEVLGLCFYAFFTPGKKVVFPDITYSFYPVYTELFHLDYEQIPLNEDFTLPVDQFLGDNGGVVICNPNAPTGKALPLKDIRRIIEANPDVVVMVDEAYVDFGAQSAISLLNQYPNLITVHTMSKSRSLAGMRLGYALGSPDLIAAVNCVKNSLNSYPIDRLALAAGTAAIQDVEHFEQTRSKVMATRARTTQTLRNLGFLVHDSNANFIFISHPSKPAAALQQGLRDRGILVRWFDKPRIRNYLRVSIGTDQEMEAMCAACQEILKG
ncbi:MAG: histidinol-phosphate transaminase [Lawsonibacter sp.]